MTCLTGICRIYVNYLYTSLLRLIFNILLKLKVRPSAEKAFMFGFYLTFRILTEPFEVFHLNGFNFPSNGKVDYLPAYTMILCLNPVSFLSSENLRSFCFVLSSVTSLGQLTTLQLFEPATEHITLFLECITITNKTSFRTVIHSHICRMYYAKVYSHYFSLDYRILRLRNVYGYKEEQFLVFQLNFSSCTQLVFISLQTVVYDSTIVATVFTEVKLKTGFLKPSQVIVVTLGYYYILFH